MSYVIKSKDGFEDYVLLVVDNIDVDSVLSFELSHVDNAQDATKFTLKEVAVEVMEEMKLHEDDWKVVEMK